MSNETKQNVFGQLLNEYQKLSEKDTEIHDENYRYGVALQDETEKQKNCPYCHETDPQSKHAHYGKAMADKTEYFDFIRKHKLYRRVKARIKSPENQHPKLCVTQMNRFREVSVVLDKEINYCPICGRKL
jgi:RNA polymerase subunit RPABC4/transcription elongation factor Spt4